MKCVTSCAWTFGTMEVLTAMLVVLGFAGITSLKRVRDLYINRAFMMKMFSIKLFPSLWTNKHEGARIALRKVTDMMRASDLEHIDIYIDALASTQFWKSAAEGMDEEKALLVTTLHHMAKNQKDLRTLDVIATLCAHDDIGQALYIMMDTDTSACDANLHRIYPEEYIQWMYSAALCGAREMSSKLDTADALQILTLALDDCFVVGSEALHMQLFHLVSDWSKKYGQSTVSPGQFDEISSMYTREVGNTRKEGSNLTIVLRTVVLATLMRLRMVDGTHLHQMDFFPLPPKINIAFTERELSLDHFKDVIQAAAQYELGVQDHTPGMQKRINDLEERVAKLVVELAATKAELAATKAELAHVKRQLKHCVDRFPELADELVNIV
jgi:uncharacterized coiled-coil protein SlyX